MYWLIAEDEADIRNLVATMASVWGHTTLTFETGRKVWEWLDKVEAGTYDGELPDFALMDIRMPGYRGDEIAQRIRSLPQLRHIPIVLMTAFVLSDEEQNRMRSESHVDDVINKPLPDFTTFQKFLEGVIARKQQQVATENNIEEDVTRPIQRVEVEIDEKNDTDLLEDATPDDEETKNKTGASE